MALIKFQNQLNLISLAIQFSLKIKPKLNLYRILVPNPPPKRAQFYQPKPLQVGITKQTLTSSQTAQILPTDGTKIQISKFAPSRPNKTYRFKKTCNQTNRKRRKFVKFDSNFLASRVLAVYRVRRSQKHVRAR